MPAASCIHHVTAHSLLLHQRQLLMLLLPLPLIAMLLLVPQEGSSLKIDCGPPGSKNACFEPSVKTKFVCHELEPVAMRCIVRNVRKELVSWMRNDGKNIPLTLGKTVFTPDKRISIDSSTQDEWNLVITTANISDSGEYLCQLYDGKNVYEKSFVLIVNKLRTGGSSSSSSSSSQSAATRSGKFRIEDAMPDGKLLQNDAGESVLSQEKAESRRGAVHIHARTTFYVGASYVSLTCTAKFLTEQAKLSPDASVDWYHQGLKQKSNGSMDISMSWRDGHIAMSVLTIYEISAYHSGQWVCVKRPSENGFIESDTHHLTVLEGDSGSSESSLAQRRSYAESDSYSSSSSSSCRSSSKISMTSISLAALVLLHLVRNCMWN